MTKYEELQDYLIHNKSVWLVTGVAGFIGSNLLEKLLTLNQRVVGLDNFSTGYQHNIDLAIEDAEKATGKLLKENFIFINGDINELKDCQKACHNVDYVLHQAALGSGPRSIEDPINTNKVNIGGFLNMLVASKNARVKRFVYAASSSTYGDHPGLPKVEDEIGKPLSPYAVTKFVNELYAGVFAETFGFKSIGLRYFNIFGKRQDPEGAYAAVIPKWVLAVLNQEEVFINGNGETSRDYCYIDNVIQMNLLSATTTNQEAVNNIYNVAVNERTSLNQLYEIITTHLKERLNQLVIKKPTYRGFRVGDVMHSQADITKAKKLLEYDKFDNIQSGISETIDWYIKNTIK